MATSWADSPLLPVSTAPLVPVAAAFSLGICLDRFLAVPFAAVMLAGVGLALAWLLGQRRKTARGTLVVLWGGCVVAGAGWHHLRHWPRPDDVGRLAGEEPTFVRLRGTVRELLHLPPTGDVLHSRPERERSTAVVAATAVDMGQGFRRCTGLVRVWVGQRIEEVRVGDDIEMLGELRAIAGPGNPGEEDFRAALEDQGIYAGLAVKTAAGVRVQQSASFWRPRATIDRLRRAAREAIETHLSGDVQPAAMALLLGDMASMAPADTQRYVRTGVIHVLAISGQHLMILCAALGLVGRLAGMRRGRLALGMMVLVVGYTLLTGARPATVRATAIVCTVTLGWLLRRPAHPLNSLAAAWLLVGLLNPADLFQFGCQLSFLSVLALYQVVAPWKRTADRLLVLNPLPVAWSWLRGKTLPAVADLTHAQAVESATAWRTLGRVVLCWVVWSFLTSAVIWLALLPLLAWRGHVISVSAALLAPIVIPLSTISLIAGFLLLLLGTAGGVVRWPLAFLTETGLRGMDGTLRLAEGVPGMYVYTSGPPGWWLLTWYALLLAAFFAAHRLQAAGGISVLTLLGWACLGQLAVAAEMPRRGQLRCTFLAVGHGGCTVLELPDGRVMLYDAGALSGPETARRHIAPFLWRRGITRIDELFVSHADLDHYNGVPDLVEAFRIGQVSCTPSFLKSGEPGVVLLLRKLATARIPVRVVRRGMVLELGPVQADVLHPPEEGPPGVENARSLVLLLRYGGRSLLLTGDLEEPGLSQVRWPAERFDVVQAPHHGSALSNTPAFARQVRPSLVVASAGRERRMKTNPYAALGSVVWETWREGAVTITMTAKSIEAETFRGGKRWSGPP